MYLWIKAFHLIAMVAWFAGLFYIFRLFVYHAKYKDQPQLTEAYTLMEKKLLYIIMHPAMGATIFLGMWLILLNPGLLTAGWIYIKLLLVLALVGYQVFASKVHKKFAKGEYFLTETQCRIINEVPTVLLILIVLLAVLKPWSH